MGAIDPAGFGKMRQAFEIAYSAANAKHLGELFTEDATLMPPDLPDVHGRSAIVDYYQGWFDQFSPSLSIATDEVRALGDFGMGRGTWKATLTPKNGGDAVQLEGKYMNLSEPQADGSWKIARHIWNMPAPSTES